MKKLSFILPFLLLLSSCKVDNEVELVKIKFYNETGGEIKKLEVNGEEIKRIRENENTDFIFFNSITLDGGFPILAPKAVVDDQYLTFLQHYFCATGWQEVNEGEFHLVLKITQFEDKSYLTYSIK